MVVISYAQNFEDVMLWRALKHIEKGFYIDIGAWMPDVDSVTKAFYDRGWSGINIEPDFDAYSKLVKERPRDINLQLAVSDKHGEADLHIIKDTGLTTLRDDIVERHLSADYLKTTTNIQVRTLNEICKEYVPSSHDIHFLKVDVDGMEEAVLKGNDWSRYRPWIVVIEATLPNSQQETYEAWEHILLSACYHFAYADGLNRFYVAAEHSELLPAFKYPPNVFDQFKLNAQHRAEALLAAESERSQLLEHELQSVYRSRCWRITAPLRITFDLVLRVKTKIAGMLQALRRKMGAVISPIMSIIICFAIAHPALKSWAMAVVRRYPRFDSWLYGFAMSRGFIGGNPRQGSNHIPSQISDLSPEARRIYAELKAAIEVNRRSN